MTKLLHKISLKLDLKDKKILYELDRNSRQSNKQVAQKVGLSEQVVGLRIKRLIDLGVIEYFFVKTNPSLLGYLHVKINLRLHNITQQKQNELLQELNQRKGIFWLSSIRGKYDLVVSIYVKSIAEFSQRYEEILGKWGNYILERNILLLEKAYTYTKAFFIGKQKSEEIVYTKGEGQVALDSLDEELLKILNQEGRKPLVDIAKALGTSADTVSYRIKSLQKKGVITGFGAKIDFSKVGHSYHIIYLKLQNMNQQKFLKLETISKLNPNVIIYVQTIGDHDVELEVEISNKEELDWLLKELRDNFVTEIKNYELLEVTREHRMTYFPF